MVLYFLPKGPSKLPGALRPPCPIREALVPRGGAGEPGEAFLTLQFEPWNLSHRHPIFLAAAAAGTVPSLIPLECTGLHQVHLEELSLRTQ